MCHSVDMASESVLGLAACFGLVLTGHCSSVFVGWRRKLFDNSVMLIV